VINIYRTRCDDHVQTVAAETQACLLHLLQVRCLCIFSSYLAVRCSPYARLLILAMCVYALLVDVRCTKVVRNIKNVLPHKDIY